MPHAFRICSIMDLQNFLYHAILCSVSSFIKCGTSRSSVHSHKHVSLFPFKWPVRFIFPKQFLPYSQNHPVKPHFCCLILGRLTNSHCHIREWISHVNVCFVSNETTQLNSLWLMAIQRWKNGSIKITKLKRNAKSD